MRAAVFCRPSRPDALYCLIQGLRASRLPLATFFRAFGARRIPRSGRRLPGDAYQRSGSGEGARRRGGAPPHIGRRSRFT